MTMLLGLLGRIVARPVLVLAVACAVIFAVVFALAGVARLMLARAEAALAPGLVTALSQALGREVRIGAAHMRGFATLAVLDVAVAAPGGFAEGTAFRAPSITAQLDLPSLALARFQRPWAAVRRVEVREPSLEVARDAAGRWDVADVLDKLRTASTGQWRAPVQISGGTATVHDAQAQVGAKVLELRQIDGRVTTADGLRFAATTEEETLGIGRLDATGAYSGATGLQLDARAPEVSVARLATLLPKHLPLTVRDGAAAVHLSTLLGALSGGAGAWGARDTQVDVDVRGIGLKLDELTAPLVAESGHIRLAQSGAGRARVTLEDVRGTVGALPVTLAGTVDGVDLSAPRFGTPAVDVRLTTEADDAAALSALFPAGTWPAAVAFSGPARVTARATGPTSALTIAGDVQAEQVRVRGVTGRDARAQVTLRPAAREGAVVEAALALAEARMGTAVARDLTATLASRTPWRDLEDAPVVTGNLKAASLSTPGGEASDISGDGTLTRESLRVEALRAGLWGGRLTGTLAVPFGAGASLTVNATLADIDVSRLPAGDLGLSGRGGGDVRVRVQPGRVTADGQVTLRDGQARGVRVTAGAARGSLEMVGTDLRLAVSHAWAETDSGRFILTDGAYRGGTSDLAAGALSARVQGGAIPTARFTERLEARATLDGTLAGTLRAPVVEARVEARNGRLDGLPFDRVSAHLTAHGASARWRDIRFERRGLVLTADGGPEGVDAAHPAGLAARIIARNANLNEVLAFIKVRDAWRVDGPLTGEADLIVRETGVDVAGRASIAGATVHLPRHGEPYPLRLARMGLDFRVSGQRLSAQEFRLERDGTAIVATGELTWADHHPRLHLTYRDQGAALEALPLDLFGIPVRLGGAATLNGTVTGPINAPSEPLVVRGQVTAPTMAVAGIAAGHAEATLAYHQGANRDELTIERSALRTPVGTLTATGRLRPGDRVDVRGGGSLRLADVARLLNGPAMAGQATVQARVAGPWTAPEVSAEASSEDIALLGRALGRVTTSARVSESRLALDGVWTPTDAQAITIAGAVPLRMDGTQVGLRRDGPLEARVTVPRQALAPLARTLPWLSRAQGEAAADVRIAGTPDHPFLAAAVVDLTGDVTLANLNGELPDRLTGADLRLRATGDARTTHISLERLTGGFGWTSGAQATGAVAAGGTVDIPRAATWRPMDWRWDVAAQVTDFPLPKSLAIVPRVSGVVQLAGQGTPRITGVLAAQQVKLAMPAARTDVPPAWGPFSFDPELSVVLQAGPGVRVAKSILRIPLRPTPLPMPPMAAGVLDRAHPAFSVTADALRAGKPDELAGTWGVVTGRLDDPRVYARYEVDKGRLAFPLNLIGAIRNKRGHLTYDLRNGLTMLD